jgi:hypothetical protein
MMATRSRFGPALAGLRVRADGGVDQAAVEAARVVRGLELHRVLRDARRAEVVALAADGDDQRVVADAPRRRDDRPSSSTNGATSTSRALAIEAGHLADAIVEVVPVGLREVVEVVIVDVHAAGRDLVQLGLPHVGAVALDQGDAARARACRACRRARGQLQAAGPSADDDDPVLCRCICHARDCAPAGARDASRSGRPACARREGTSPGRPARPKGLLDHIGVSFAPLRAVPVLFRSPASASCSPAAGVAVTIGVLLARADCSGWGATNGFRLVGMPMEWDMVASRMGADPRRLRGGRLARWLPRRHVVEAPHHLR